MTAFTPGTSLAGGLLIGTASMLLWFGLGRIAGISGIVAGALPLGSNTERGWRMAFVIAVVASGALAFLLSPQFQPGQVSVPMPLVIIGGLLVGFGTRLGSGCTSGHGVCGIGRFSVRSVVATCTFMLVAGITVYLVRHVAGVGV